jgi:hypothetical protein
MALITRATNASPDTSTAMTAPQVSLYAAEALDACAPCRVGTAGQVFMSNGTAANASANVHGFTPVAYAAGDPVTLLGPGTRFRYAASGLTEGQRLHLGATAGRLDNAATTGDAAGIAFAVSTTDIVFANYKLMG